MVAVTVLVMVVEILIMVVMLAAGSTTPRAYGSCCLPEHTHAKYLGDWGFGADAISRCLLTSEGLDIGVP
eukprot:10921449-Alexandrium_andersonii.AAC.1